MVTYFMIYSTAWIEFTFRKLSWSLDKCLAHCIKVAHGAYLVHIAMTILGESLSELWHLIKSKSL